MYSGTDGRKDTVDVTGPIIFELLGRDTLEEALVRGDEVLVGQTVLEKLDLLADGQSRNIVANPAHPDQPVTKVKYGRRPNHRPIPATPAEALTPNSA